MTDLRRFRLLLRAYEELVQLETFGLRQQNFEYLASLRTRKEKIFERMLPLQKAINLTPEEAAEIKDLVDGLQCQEQANLESLAAAMESVKSSLKELNRSASKYKKLRTSYGKPSAGEGKPAFAGKA